MNDSLLLEVTDGVATVILNRPKSLNALSGDMKEAFSEVVPRLAEDDGVRCVVIRGAGEHFMAGGDLKGFHELMGEPSEARRAHFRETIGNLHPNIVALRTMPKPVVASVRGAAAGFGLSLVMAADLAIAADDAFFTLAYCRIGTTPDGGW